MKIEMGESLVFSWLRKVRGCQLVQTNWKPAPEWERLNEEELSKLKDNAERYFAEVFDKIEGSVEADDASDEYEVDDKLTDSTSTTNLIFKQTSGLSQLIAQTECDVLGILFEDGKYKATAVEVAFHENGLNYSGGRKVTAKKIISKFLRIIIALRACFGVDEAELIFASPHVKKACVAQVEQVMDELNAFLEDNNLKGFSVSVLFNEDFYTELMIPVSNSVKDKGASDGSELFVRALKLVELANATPRKNSANLPEDEEPEQEKAILKTARTNIGALTLSVNKSKKVLFKKWMIDQEFKPSVCNSYVSVVNTSSSFARDVLGWQDWDFFAMNDANQVELLVNELLKLPSYIAYSKKSSNSRKCGLERYVEFLRSGVI